MPVTTASYMRTRFPLIFGDAVAFPDAVLDAAIAEAEPFCSRLVFGSRYDQAILYYAAHLALSEQRGQGEGISSATAGPVSVVYDRAFERKNFYNLWKSLAKVKRVPVGISGC